MISPNRYEQLARYIQEERECPHNITGSLPEIQFKTSLQSLPPALAVFIEGFFNCRFEEELAHGDLRTKIHCFQLGNGILAYIAQKLPDLVYPFENETIEYPNDEEGAIKEIRQRMEIILNFPSISKWINTIKPVLNALIDQWQKRSGKAMGHLAEYIVENGVAPPDLEPQLKELFSK